MTVEKAGGYISELEFNTGEKVQINRNDIVVLSVLIMQEKVSR